MEKEWKRKWMFESAKEKNMCEKLWKARSQKLKIEKIDFLKKKIVKRKAWKKKDWWYLCENKWSLVYPWEMEVVLKILWKVCP